MTVLFVLFCTAGLLLPSLSARSGEYEPIEIVAEDPYAPGQSIPCHVSLTGPEAVVTVYSAPAGAVSFHGLVQNDTTFLATTDAAMLHGQTITLYVVTDGQEVVSTTAHPSATSIPHTPTEP